MSKKIKHTRRPPIDAAKAIELINDHMRRQEWQYHAIAELCNMAIDIGAAWPPRRDLDIYTALVHDAYAYLQESLRKPDSTEDAYFAGKLMQQVLDRWETVIVARKGKRDTSVFNQLAANLVDGGTLIKVAADDVANWCKANGKEFGTEETLRKYISNRSK